jgi:subtilisin-like proprotein convertase family protein
MKKAIFLSAVALLALAQTAQASFSYNFIENAVIPDGDLNGAAFTHQLTDVGGALPGAITDLNVTLNLSGGYNGDLYAYLVHSTGFTVLLNRIGRSGTSGPGYSGSSLYVSLDDAGALGDIHTYGGGALTPPDGPPATSAASYQPDGRTADPLTGNMTPLGSTTLSSFNGLLGTGAWTLYLADVSGGDVSTLNSWTLEIAAVPEPASWLEASVAVLFLGGALGLYRLKGKKVQLPVAA